MTTKNVYYGEKPHDFIITANGNKAKIEFPVNVTEIKAEDGSQYLAETVYSIMTRNTENLEERVEANFDKWLEKAKEIEPKQPDLSDIVEALNALTDLVIGV